MRWPRALFATWDASTPARRMSIAVVAIAIALAVVLFALRPLTTAIDRTQADVERIRAMLGVAQARIADSASLERTPPPLHAGDLRAAVDSVLARHELRAVPAASATSDGRYAVVVDDARFDVLVAALDALGRDDGVHVVEATLAARVEPGRVRADLTFTR
jgi:type II secretory pathway component PulM